MTHVELLALGLKLLAFVPSFYTICHPERKQRTCCIVTACLLTHSSLRDIEELSPEETPNALGLSIVVPKKGLEPPHPCGYMDLNHARLPIPPLRPVHYMRSRRLCFCLSEDLLFYCTDTRTRVKPRANPYVLKSATRLQESPE